jgi:nucleoside transporter
VSPSPRFLTARLSVHTALNFAIIGAWISGLPKVLKDYGFTDAQINLILSASAAANLLSPLLAGQAVDRWFAVQRFVAAGSLLTGGFLLLAYFTTAFAPLLMLTVAAQLCFVSTVPLAVTLSYRHLADPPRQFPFVRAMGTLGWVVGAWGLSGWLQLLPSRSLRDGFLLAAGLAFAHGIFALTLPHTPPRGESARRFALAEALGIAKTPGFATFLALMFVLQACTTFFYARGPIFLGTVGVADRNLPLVISIGQAVEIGVIFALPWMHARLGVKGTIAAGIVCWIARYGIFALGAPAWLVIGSLALHGPCFAFGRIAATMYVEKVAPPDARASAQGLLTVVMDGAGILLGYGIGALLAGRYLSSGTADWRTFWILPAAACTVLLAAYLALFRPKR